MNVVGSCPGCGARVALGVTPPLPFGRCASCGATYMVAIPDGALDDAEGSGDEREVELLPRRETRPAYLASRGLHRPLLLGLVGLGVLVLAFVVIGLLRESAPRVSALVAALAAPLLVLPFAAALAALAVRFFFERPAPDAPPLYWKSVIAITAGVTILGWSLLLPSSVSRLLGPSWVIAAASWIAPALAGWATVRLAPAQPYRHALGVVLVSTFGMTLFLLPQGWAAVGALFFVLFFLPLILLGAWVSVRFGPSAGRPGAPA